ncbi:MAG: hypothetical protein AMJ69_05295 [Gammaproteobacteria bacterium SG8_47]|nr:MAG: hypothetical protein AMJ69_05295 [Gammaproteobacteria bacterium SG8_47]
MWHDQMVITGRAATLAIGYDTSLTRALHRRDTASHPRTSAVHVGGNGKDRPSLQPLRVAKPPGLPGY